MAKVSKSFNASKVELFKTRFKDCLLARKTYADA